MRRLIDCPLEVLERIESLLQLHHLARLYATGDTTMRLWLEALRHRIVDLCQYSFWTKSDLLDRFLVGGASSVTCNGNFVNIAAWSASPLRIRRLTIQNEHNSGINGIGGCHDFSSLTTLEMLETSGWCRLIAPLVLPPSITTVELNGVTCVEPIKSMDLLPRLSTISVLFAIDARRVSTEFIASAKWPTSLTSLKITLDACSPKIYAQLPNNLLCLTLAGVNPSLDLAELARPQIQLQQLRVPNGWVFIKGKLPVTIEELVVSELIIPRGKTVVETFNHLPSTLRRFSCYGISAQVDDLVPEDVACAYRSIMPRMLLSDLETAFQFLCTDVPTAVDDDFMAFLLDLLKRYALDAKYVDAIRTRNDWTTPRHFDLKRVASLLHNGVPVETIRRIIGNRDVYDSMYRLDSSVSVNAHYETEWLSLLSMGFTRGLNLDQCRVGVEAFREELPSKAIANLLQLRISTTCLLRLNALLGHTCLFNLKRIDVLVHDVNLFSNVVDILHNHRLHLPHLDTIVLHRSSAAHAYKLAEPETRRKLADMGLFVSRSDDYLVRFVQNPPVTM